jgi:hypothetical protein
MCVNKIALRLVLLVCISALPFPQGLLADDADPDAPTENPDNQANDPAPEPVPDEGRERELAAEEDPLAKEQVEIVEEPATGIVERGDWNLYGSIRLRERETNLGPVSSDGGSRVGLTGGWRFNPKLRVFGRGEVGFNILDQVDFVFHRGDRPQGQKFNDTFFRRLLHVGVETPDFVVTAGKNWSTYYRVSSFTDRFQGTGASASGTYNAGTDGGYTGTGRADEVLQARVFLDTFERKSAFKPLGLGLQFQEGQPIPGFPEKSYQTTIGVSSVHQDDNGLAIGIAYNHANIDNADLVDLQAGGIDGDATALVIGTRWYGDRWYVGTLVSRLENHETTDMGTYFDGRGWEVYAQYNLLGKWWAVAGWNKLKPDGGEVQAGAFKIDYGVLGVRYSFQQFRQMIFANARFNSGKTQEGIEVGDVYTIGVRWDLP